jgi:two-component system NtrC family sensor kinase
VTCAVEPGRHLDILYTVAATLGRSLDLDEVLKTALDALTHVTGHEISSLHLLSTDGSTLALKGDRGLSDRLRAVNRILRPGEGLIGSVVREGRALVLPRVLESPDLLPAARDAVRADGILGFLCVPIRAQGTVLGALSLGRREPDPFTPDEVRLVEATADQIGVAIDNARLYSETRRQLEELKRTQAQLVHAEKLAAIGELAAGVAHEINNPLTTILGQAQLMAAGPIGDMVGDRLKIIAEESGRAARLMQSLLLFARQYPPQRSLCAVRDLVLRVLDLTAHQFQVDDIRVITEFEMCPPVWADDNQIQQVLLNLVQNAHQAMAAAHGRGVLTVRVRPMANAVHVEVLDDGPGVPPENLSRLFDPFFTTKPPGQGSGLGLSVSWGIVAEHGGRLWAENRPEGGAAFRLELPLGSPAPSFGGPAPRLAPAHPLRALLVEDERRVADVLSNLLRSLGHSADVALGGPEALARVAETAYDVAFVDLKMPGMDGRAFWRELKARGSPLAHRTVFMTGNPRSLEAREVEAAGAQMLAKPFTVQELAAALGAATLP